MGKYQNYYTMGGPNKKYSFSDFVNLREPASSNPQSLWPEKKSIKAIKENKHSRHQVIEQPRLLQSAICHLRKQHDKLEAEAMSEVLSHSSSNFILSRQNTPLNPVPKKRMRNKTKGSQLFDIESKGSRGANEQDQFDQLILTPRYYGLSEAIYLEVIGKQKRVNPSLIQTWKDCLYLEDKTEIYGENANYSFSRIFPVNELEKGFTQIYGGGKKRTLRGGEESLLIYHMERYLQKCNIEIKKIARKHFDIINDILSSSKLEELEGFPNCIKQVQLMWKVMATYWRYSGKLDLQNKILESALINGRNNFLDLKKESPLTTFLLSSSNFVELNKNR